MAPPKVLKVLFCTAANYLIMKVQPTEYSEYQAAEWEDYVSESITVSQNSPSRALCGNLS